MAAPTHTTSTEEVPTGEHGAGFPPFNAQTFPAQLIWLAIFFALLYALMAKWALPQVGRVIDDRQKRIAGDIAEAQRLKQESEAAVAAYEKALADARGRAQAIANETRDRAAADAAAARKIVEDALNAKLAEADKSIAATKQAAMGNVRAVAEDAAAAVVERLIGLTPSEKTVADAVAAVLKG
jgi:F-type H+-transporting ATPase subunit b